MLLLWFQKFCAIMSKGKSHAHLKINWLKTLHLAFGSSFYSSKIHCNHCKKCSGDIQLFMCLEHNNVSCVYSLYSYGKAVVT